MRRRSSGIAVRRTGTWVAVAAIFVGVAGRVAAYDEVRHREVVRGGLDWLAAQQTRIGSWEADNGKYPTAMTALAGMALAGEGSTTMQGRYARNIRRAVDYLTNDLRARENGLIGDPTNDDRYTYGHGFAMLFLSQVLGEEEDEERRRELIDILTRAVRFTGQAQTPQGGWGYVSSRDGGGFDEGSTTVTQVQGLRACRNAGIVAPREVIESAVKYIRDCTNAQGGVRYQYQSRDDGGRPAITAAAIACLFNAGEYDDENVPRMFEFCRRHLWDVSQQGYGHWHYAHYYYAQVLYREGDDAWVDYRDRIYDKLLKDAVGDGDRYFWSQGFIGKVYTTSLNLTILQLDNAVLPIYQR